MSRHIEFFYDLSSPYSYLASTQVDAVAAREGATVAWRPFLLGAVFKATGNVMPAACPPKAKYMFQDLARWAARYGVPFHFSQHFPVNALKAERLIVGAARSDEAVAHRLARAAFHALWGGPDRDLTSEAVLRELAIEAGLDAVSAIAALDDQAVKDALRANCDEAIRRGSFGAPTFFVGEQLFVGNDRLDFVAEALRREAP